MLPPASLEGHARGTGSVTGQVDVIARPTRRLATAGSYPGRTVELPAARRPSEFQNVVVFLDSDAAEPSEPTRVTIRQTHEEFLPHLVAVTAGSTVDFPNDDLVFHNVFSLSHGATFDLGRYPKNASKSRTFSEPGIIKVFCHLHSHMSAIVRVFPHPHFVVPDDRGQFTLEGLPAGKHVIAAWHERVGIVRHEVTVADGGVTETTFSLPLMDDK
jgi:plastocyanin